MSRHVKYISSEHYDAPDAVLLQIGLSSAVVGAGVFKYQEMHQLIKLKRDSMMVSNM